MLYEVITKKTSAFQNVFVIFLLVILVAFIIDGFYSIFTTESINIESLDKQFTPFFTNGFVGLFTTVGFVFVSYLGLTQIASVAEEIKNPERNIPLGMILVITSYSIHYTKLYDIRKL